MMWTLDPKYWKVPPHQWIPDDKKSLFSGIRSGFHDVDSESQVLEGSTFVDSRLQKKSVFRDSGFQRVEFWISRTIVSWIPESELSFMGRWLIKHSKYWESITEIFSPRFFHRDPNARYCAIALFHTYKDFSWRIKWNDRNLNVFLSWEVSASRDSVLFFYFYHNQQCTIYKTT